MKNNIISIMPKIIMFFILSGYIFLLLPVIFFIFILIFNYNWYTALYVFIPSAGILMIVASILINLRKTVKMVFSELNDDYERKTNKELYSFVAWSCVVAFLFTIITYQIFINIAILYWVLFIAFMIMFSRVWKFHEKKRINLFLIITPTIILSFFTAPFARNTILIIFNFFSYVTNLFYINAS